MVPCLPGTQTRCLNSQDLPYQTTTTFQCASSSAWNTLQTKIRKFSAKLIMDKWRHLPTIRLTHLMTAQWKTSASSTRECKSKSQELDLYMELDPKHRRETRTRVPNMDPIRCLTLMLCRFTIGFLLEADNPNCYFSSNSKKKGPVTSSLTTWTMWVVAVVRPTRRFSLWGYHLPKRWSSSCSRWPTRMPVAARERVSLINGMIYNHC